MATPLATAFVRIRPDTSGFEKEAKQDLTKAGRGLAQEGKKHGRLFGASFARSSAGPLRAVGGVLTSSLAGIGGAFAAVGAVKVFAGFISDARESNKIARITAQAIKSTGGAAHVTAKQVGDLSTAISNKTGKDDEAIQSGQNLLLTFTNIRNETGKGNDIFNQASSAIVDMTAALNNGEVSSSGLKASSIQLGKALNDPIKGVTALRKVGVSFTDQQTKQIKKLVESGDTLKAQKIILRELGKEFGGAAAASTDPMEKLRVVVGNLGEKLGKILLPALTTIATVIANKVIPVVSKFFDGMGDATPIVATISKFIKTNLVPAVKALAGFIGGSVVPAVKQWLGILADALLPSLHALGEIWKQNIRPALKGLFEAVQRNWPAFKRLATIILVVAGFILKYLLPVIIRVAGVIISYWIRNITLQIKIMGVLIRWIITAGKAIGTFAVATARHFVQWYQAARNAVQNVVDFFRKLPGRITAAVGGLGTLLYNRGKAVVTGFWNGVKAVWKDVISWFKGLPTKILHALGMSPPPKWATEGGKKIMLALLKGIIPGGKNILTYAKGIVSSLSTTLGGAQIRFGGGGGAIKGSPMEIAQKMVPEWATGAQWRAWYDLWQNESGWNPLADNPTSTAFGIPQFIKSTAQAYGVYGSTDPARQIAAGAQYISDRYGDPIHAWAHWTRFHSYDQGGWLMPGATLAVNKTGRPERISPPGVGGNTYNINIAVPPSANQHDIGRQIVTTIRAYEKGSGTGWRK